jgi:hypothetical protein
MKVFYIENDDEYIVKFTIWTQTFSLYPISKLNEVYKWESKDSLNFTIKQFKKAFLLFNK